MTTRELEVLEQQLGFLREQQARLAAAGQGGGTQAQALAREIVVVAGQLGFEPDEADAIAGQVDAPASGPGHAMAGEYQVLRGAAEPILSFAALVIAAAVISLGQPIAGVVVIVVVLAGWFIRASRRVARVRIDGSGALSFPGYLDRIDPSELVGIDFAYRYPPGLHGYKKAASETVDLRLRLSHDRSIQLAHGPLWRVSPARAPVAYVQLERHLAAQARGARMTIERSATGWTARR